MSLLTPTPEEDLVHQATRSLQDTYKLILDDYATKRTRWRFTYTVRLASGMRFGSESLDERFARAWEATKNPTISTRELAHHYGLEDTHIFDPEVTVRDGWKLVFYYGSQSGRRGYGLMDPDAETLEMIVLNELVQRVGLSAVSYFAIRVLEHERAVAQLTEDFVFNAAPSH